MTAEAVDRPKTDLYWQRYHDADSLSRAESLRTTHSLQSTGVRIHIDVYAQPGQDAPVLLFNHGGGGYSRMFIPLALALYDAGFTVILPDQRGQGLSEGDRGDYVVNQFVQNIRDAAYWARSSFAGDLFMAGGSFGGSLTYMAASAGAPVKGIICHNLYDLGSPVDALALSRFAFMARIPGLARLISWQMALSASILPRLRVPFGLLGNFRAMVDDRAGIGFYDIWRRDPVPIKRVSLRYLRSTFNSPPAVPFEANTLPVLVVNPVQDRMTHPSVTKRNYERLGGPKQYAEIAYGHWATGEAFYREWAALARQFVDSLG